MRATLIRTITLAALLSLLAVALTTLFFTDTPRLESLALQLGVYFVFLWAAAILASRPRIGGGAAANN